MWFGMARISDRRRSAMRKAAFRSRRLRLVSTGSLRRRPAFQRLQRTGITVEVNQSARVTLSLSVGELSTTVDVIGDAPIVQSQTSEVSMSIGSKQIRDLPLNGKDFQKLMMLAPGTGNFRSNNTNSNVSTSGTRESSNNYVIDGTTANDERETAGLALGAAFRQQPNVISTEAISEFRVITSNADASFGRGAGAQVNVVTRSGTNQFHGAAHEYLRNSALDARDFFNRGPSSPATDEPKLLRSDRVSLTLRHVQTRYNSVNNSSGLPGTGVRTPGEYISPTAQATWSISAAQVLEVRTGVMRRFTDNEIVSETVSVQAETPSHHLEAVNCSRYTLIRLRLRPPFHIWSGRSVDAVLCGGEDRPELNQNGIEATPRCGKVPEAWSRKPVSRLL